MFFRICCVKIFWTTITVTETNQGLTNLNGADFVIILKLRDLEQTYIEVKRNCSHQT